MYKSYFTYGFELELADVDRRTKLPNGCTWNNAEITLVNSNGNAVHSYDSERYWGGEINTVPTRNIIQQLDYISKCLKLFPKASVNYRCNTQVTIGFDRAVFNVNHVKDIVKYSYENYDDVMEATVGTQPRINKHTNYTKRELDNIMNAEDFPSLFYTLFTSPSGKITPFAFKRRYVNIQALFKYGAIEFRHFYGSKDPNRIADCFKYAKEFTHNALNNGAPVKEWIGKYKFPPALPFDLSLETLYNASKAPHDRVKHLKQATTNYYTTNGLNYRLNK